MNSTAAVSGFIILIDAVTRLIRATGCRSSEPQAGCGIVVNHAVVLNGDIRSAHHQNALKVCVLYLKSGNGDLLQAGMVETIHEDAMREPGGINNRGTRTRSDNRHWKTNDHFFAVGTGFNLDEIVGSGMVDGGLDALEAVVGTGRVDAKGPRHGSLADGDKHHRRTEN